MARRAAPSFLLPRFGTLFGRISSDIARTTMNAGTDLLQQAVRTKNRQRQAATGTGDWIAGMAFGPAGSRKYRLFRPPGIASWERRPLVVMLHGCDQDAASFAAGTRINRIAMRERFLVLYPEQDRRANANGCWNWFDTRSGRAYAEAATIAAAIDQVQLLYPVDKAGVAVAGLSAGASMAALLATRYPQRFQAVVMHSGVPPGTAHSPVSALSAMQGRRSTAAPSATAALPPLLVIHGSDDAIVAAENGRAAVQAWAQAMGATEGQPRFVQRGQRLGMAIREFRRRGSRVATLCEVEGLRHAWSGGDASHPYGDPEGPDASRLVWSFLARQLEKAGK